MTRPLDEDAPEPRRVAIHAALYGLILREKGYTPEQAAELVIAAYPSTRVQLGFLASRAVWPPERPES